MAVTVEPIPLTLDRISIILRPLTPFSAKIRRKRALLAPLVTPLNKTWPLLLTVLTTLTTSALPSALVPPRHRIKVTVKIKTTNKTMTRTVPPRQLLSPWFSLPLDKCLIPAEVVGPLVPWNSPVPGPVAPVPPLPLECPPLVGTSSPLFVEVADRPPPPLAVGARPPLLAISGPARLSPHR